MTRAWTRGTRHDEGKQQQGKGTGVAAFPVSQFAVRTALEPRPHFLSFFAFSRVACPHACPLSLSPCRVSCPVS